MRRTSALSVHRSYQHQLLTRRKKMPAQAPRRADLSGSSCTSKDRGRQRRQEAKRRRRSNGKKPRMSASLHLKCTRLIWEEPRIQSLQNPSRNLEKAWRKLLPSSCCQKSKEHQARSRQISTQTRLRTRISVWCWVAPRRKSRLISVLEGVHGTPALKRSTVSKWRLLLATRPTF